MRTLRLLTLTAATLLACDRAGPPTPRPEPLPSSNPSPQNPAIASTRDPAPQPRAESPPPEAAAESSPPEAPATPPPPQTPADPSSPDAPAEPLQTPTDPPPPDAPAEPAPQTAPAKPSTTSPVAASRTCRRDNDCELLPPRPCSCPPCGDVLREAVNHEHADELRSRWARKRCRQPECSPCEGRFIGARATCDAGECVTRL